MSRPPALVAAAAAEKGRVRDARRAGLGRRRSARAGRHPDLHGRRRGAAFARAEPILAAMGRTIVHAGPSGSGQTAKICNNMILAVSMIAVCEGFALAEKLGLPAQTLFDICSTSTSQCWAMTSYCPMPGPVPAAPSNRGYAAGFTAANMLKDLRLAQQAAGATAAATPLGRGGGQPLPALCRRRRRRARFFRRSCSSCAAPSPGNDNEKLTQTTVNSIVKPSSARLL